MRIIVPFISFPVDLHMVGVQPETRAALERLAPGLVEYHELGPADDAYTALLERVWREPGDLAIVEQDIVVRADVLDAFESCPEPWCAFPYSIQTQVAPALGCTRFREELRRELPDAVTAAGDQVDGLPKRHWRRLDVRLMLELNQAGRRWHVHEPAVRHLNPAQLLRPS